MNCWKSLKSTGANSLQEFAVSVGVEDSIRGFLLSDLSAVESYETELNENLQSRELAEYFSIPLFRPWKGQMRLSQRLR